MLTGTQERRVDFSAAGHMVDLDRRCHRSLSHSSLESIRGGFFVLPLAIVFTVVKR